MHGTTNILFEGTPTHPTPERWWSIVEKYGVTILYTSPTAIRGLMRFGEEWPARRDLSSLRLLGSVGEPINPEVWMWYRQHIGRDRLPIVDTWWQTETGMILVAPTVITPLKPGSIARPFPTIEADVVNKHGLAVGQGSGGFLIIRHPWPAQMRTIHGDPARYISYWNTVPGVYFAGDAAFRDRDGYFPEAAAIGKPDDSKGERIKAFIILKQGIDPSDSLAGELRQQVRATVGSLAVPDELEFVQHLPKTRSGKIMRRVLRAREIGEPVGDLSTLDG